MWNKLLRRAFKPENAVEIAALEAIASDNTLSDRICQTLYYAEWFIPEFSSPTHPDNQGKMALPIFKVEGRLMIPVFSSDHLLLSVLPIKTYSSAKGFDMIDVWPEECSMLLNAGSPIEMVLPPDVIRDLPKPPVKGTLSTPMYVPSGTTVFIGEPSSMPNGLMEDLSKVCEKSTNVSAMYRAWIHLESTGEEPHLAVGLALGDHDQFRNVVHEITNIVARYQPYLVDIFLIDHEALHPITEYMLSNTLPVYQRVA